MQSEKEKYNPLKFKAKIEIIGINPFVFLPENVLKQLFKQANKDKGKIPVNMKIDGHSFTQTLVKHSGHWRLYLNTPMRRAAGKEVGDTARFGISYNDKVKVIPLHPKLLKALKRDKAAKKIFDSLSPSRRLEIVRYISFLKTEESINRNVDKAINFLKGKTRFVGRREP